ncbi:MAG TPA: ATP-binding cassette domain-containing protein [Ktedonobacteraceae bacterium]|nr:ATP-binding cassette domain-containing protein [Ktedonobacteraceae bacterium]
MLRDTRATQNNGMLAVQLEQRLGNFHLNVDFQVPLGLIVLFGYSGAGKSLTLQSLAGLLRPARGQITVDGQVLYDSQAAIDVPPQERRIGYVPQRYALFPHLTVEQNVRFALPATPFWSRVKGKSAAHAERVAELLDALELQDLAKRYPGNLSGGQQQRVALARALAAEPRLLLLDEPFNALDASVRERLRDALKSFQRRFTIPIVLVTHDHVEVQQLADTVIVMQRGRVEQIGSVQQVFFTPRSAAVAQLVGHRNIFGGCIASTRTTARDASTIHEKTEEPGQAIRLNWLQITNTQAQVVAPQSNEVNGCWLPLPFSASSASSTQSVARVPVPETYVSGCMLASEMLLHRLPDGEQPPTWTARGAALWIVELREANIQGASMRLLVRPLWNGPLRSPASQNVPEGLLEVYLSFSQWRAIQVEPGERLLLEIGPQAIHLFEELPPGGKIQA